MKFKKNKKTKQWISMLSLAKKKVMLEYKTFVGQNGKGLC